MPFAVLLALAACGQNASDLQNYLHDQHQYDHDYALLNGATYSDDGGRVVIKTQTLTEFTAAQNVCDWASEWLYGNGNSGSIKVLNRDGDVLAQRRAETDVCAAG